MNHIFTGNNHLLPEIYRRLFLSQKDESADNKNVNNLIRNLERKTLFKMDIRHYVVTIHALDAFI